VFNFHLNNFKFGAKLLDKNSEYLYDIINKTEFPCDFLLKIFEIRAFTLQQQNFIIPDILWVIIVRKYGDKSARLICETCFIIVSNQFQNVSYASPIYVKN